MRVIYLLRPAYLSGDFRLVVNAKSIDGIDENAANQFNLNFSIDATSQGSLVEVSSAQTTILKQPSYTS